jgi:hypothetical protein
MGGRRQLVAAVTGAATLTIAPGVARAHDVTASRFDAPLPLSLLFAGAAGAVVLTAVLLATTERSPSGTRRVVTLSPRVARAGRALAGATFFAGVVAAVVVGIGGPRAAAGNFATVFVWPVWFRGVALLAVLVGTPWPALSPWRAAYRWLCRLEGGEVRLVGPPPARLGAWPAFLSLVLLVGVVENLTVLPRSPPLTAAVVAVYGLWSVGGAALFGPLWLARADPLGLLYRLFGRVAPVETARTDAGLVVSLRPPWHAATRSVAGPAVVATVIVAVYTVTFDGFTETRLYRDLLLAVREGLGTGPPTSVPLYLLGLAAFLAVFLAAVRLGDALGGPTNIRVGPARAFAPTVLPIAAAYDVAHNYPYVVRSTARLADIVAGVGAFDPLAALLLPAYWGSQVALVVLGHLIAVVAADRVACARYPTRAAARRGHLPLVAVMVGYTVLSLWVVSRPIVG